MHTELPGSKQSLVNCIIDMKYIPTADRKPQQRRVLLAIQCVKMYLESL